MAKRVLSSTLFINNDSIQQFKSITLLVIMITVFISITGCEQSQRKVKFANERHVHLIEKSKIPASFFKRKTIYPLVVNSYSFVEISEWFNDESILYLKDENGVSYLQKYHLFSGTDTLFFEIKDPILEVMANNDYSLFAIKVIPINGPSPLYIVDKEGQVQFTFDEIGEEFELIWNNYDSNELIVASYTSDWIPQLYQIHVSDQKVHKLPLMQGFVQWIGKNDVAYLDWDDAGLSYFAPLYTYDIKHAEQKLWLNDIIAMFSLGDNLLLTISVEETSDKHSLYTFFDINSRNVVSTMKVPILNTYSSQWWIPFHVYDKLTNDFFYFKPYYADNIIDYEEGYQLISYNIKTKEQHVVTEVNEQYPVKLSPSGKWLLYGQRKEQLVDLSNKSVVTLVEL
ncbi:hypothetical protein ACJ2A9_05310 [Anaerobacillus sp. MEB173]|uniref:YqgU-like beta propeller domain-containing protein n=1 Tax=Anaerobacillus sp. MEB173 TaxID=3383345 RepID=UPI003F8F9A4A